MISTFSKFWYGWEVTQDKNLLDFQYASDLSPRVAKLRPGKYSTGGLGVEICRALKVDGKGDFQISFDRTTRKFTNLRTSSGDVFSILSMTGDNVASGGAWGVVGFDDASDKTGSASYTADISTGNEWKPQFKLQGIVMPGQKWNYRNPTKSKTASGDPELSHSGKVSIVEFEAVFITDIIQPNEQIIRNCGNAVSSVDDFMAWAGEIGPVEFMADENTPSAFSPLLLSSTEFDQDGIGWERIEMTDKDLPNYFRTGKLTWEVYEG